MEIKYIEHKVGKNYVCKTPYPNCVIGDSGLPIGVGSYSCINKCDFFKNIDIHNQIVSCSFNRENK